MNKNFCRDASKYFDMSNKLEIFLFYRYFYPEIKKDIYIYVCVYVCIEKRDRQRNIDKTISDQCSHTNVEVEHRIKKYIYIYIYICFLFLQTSATPRVTILMGTCKSSRENV